MSDMAKNLERIKNAAEHLNKLSDEANEAIRAVESALQETGAGLRYQSPDLNPGSESEWLGWMRHDSGKFRLTHQSSDSSHWLPLLDTRRDIRIRVVKLLPDFVYAYAKHVSGHMASMELDMARARESTKELSEALTRLSSNG